MSEATRLLECQQASEYLSNRLSANPQMAIFCGTGLSAISEHFDVLEIIPYSDIPNMPSPSVSSHQPELRVLRSNNTVFLLFGGRFHHYEGRTMHEIVFPVRICQGLGIKTVIFTNAAGGLHSQYHPGEIVLIRDHINLLPDNPLRGLTLPEWGDRFPDPKSIYDLELRGKVRSHGLNKGIHIKEGVYACLSGPNLETRAELKHLKIIGADLVGMSTVPEILVAAQARMTIIGLSVVTNIVDPDAPMDEVTLEDVIAASQKAVPPLAEMIKYLG